MVISKRKILTSKLCLWLIFMMIFYPKAVDYSHSLIASLFHLVYLNLPYVALPILIAFFWNCNKTAGRLYIGILLFQITFLVSDFINGADRSTVLIWYKNCMWTMFSAVVICSGLYYDRYKLLFTLRQFCNITCMINLILMILFPNGVTTIEMINTEWKVVSWTDAVNFIDADNRLSLFLLVTIFVNALWQYNKNDKISKWFYFFIPLVTILLAWSGTGILAIVWIFVYMVFSDKKYIAKLVSGYWIFAAYAIVFLLFVVFQRFEIFEFFIVNILHKQMNLSNRTTIWAYYIGQIIQKPFFGFGTADGSALFNMNGTVWYAHNQILDILAQGGTASLSVFLFTMIAVKKRVDKNSNHRYKGIFNAVLLAFLIVGIAEHFLVRFNMCFYAFLAVSYSMNSLNSNNMRR